MDEVLKWGKVSAPKSSLENLEWLARAFGFLSGCSGTVQVPLGFLVAGVNAQTIFRATGYQQLA